MVESEGGGGRGKGGLGIPLAEIEDFFLKSENALILQFQNLHQMCLNHGF